MNVGGLIFYAAFLFNNITGKNKSVS